MCDQRIPLEDVAVLSAVACGGVGPRDLEGVTELEQGGVLVGALAVPDWDQREMKVVRSMDGAHGTRSDPRARPRSAPDHSG